MEWVASFHFSASWARFEVLGTPLLKDAELAIASVVDENVNPAEGLDRGGDSGPGRVGVAHVVLDGANAVAVLLQERVKLIELAGGGGSRERRSYRSGTTGPYSVSSG